MGILYALFGFIDWAIYSIVKVLLNLIFFVAEQQLINNEAVNAFRSRIYSIIAIFILFKILYSLILYLINPDSFLDKDKGFASIIKNVVISVALIAVVPKLFEFAIYIQKPISEVIPEILLKNNESNGASSNAAACNSIIASNGSISIDNAGECMAFTTLSAFFEANNGKSEIESIDDFGRHISDGCHWLTGKNCKYQYRVLISTAAGAFMCYILLSMALDVAIRSIKLSILQLLAPVPISSYINNKTNFEKWYKLCFKVYTDLFIRFIIIYFIVYLMTIIPNIQLLKESTGNVFYNVMIRAVLIIGLFMFAKDAPNFISEALGLDAKVGDFKDMFKPAWQRAGGAAAILGAGTAGVSNFVNSFRNTKGEKTATRLRKAIHSGVGGTASAAIHGSVAALQGKNVKETFEAGHGRAIKARQNRDMDKVNRVRFHNRLAARAKDFMGIATDASLAEGKQKAYSTIHQDTSNFKKSVFGRLEKNPTVSLRTDFSANGALSQLGQLLTENRSAIVSSGNADLLGFADRFEAVTDSSGSVTGYKLKAGGKLSYHDIAAINADAMQAGIGSISSRTGENGTITKLAEKEIMLDAMVGKVKNTDGGFNKDINVVEADGVTINESAHSDVRTAYGQAMQHITENALDLGELEVNFGGGRVEKRVGAEAIQKAYRENYSAVDDAVQTESAKLSSNISTNKEAAARASIQRRDGNKKS